LTGALTIARKEMRDSVGDNIFIAVFMSFLIIVISMTVSSAANYNSRIAYLQNPQNTVFEIYGDSDSPSLRYSFDTLIGILAVICPGLAVMLSFNSVNKERLDGSLKVSLSYPLYRDQIFLGKIISGFLLISTITFSVILIEFASFIYLTGISFTIDLLIRILFFFISTLLYMMLFYSLGLLFSILLNSSVTSLLFGIVAWVFATDIYKRITDQIGDLIFGKQDSYWNPIISKYLGITVDPLNTIRYDSFLKITGFLDVSGNYITLLQNALTTLTVQLDSYNKPIIKNVDFNSITLNLAIPSAVIITFIIITVLISYIIFNKMEIT
jgi:ABC-2 type transport system permease protein